ncbi:MAG TPA: PHB depolymerase family esterase, partial [Casimicrobiaceae bacterium]|nr:PHB depolymerase family esterase [Casimicrobiaceae bacterium]
MRLWARAKEWIRRLFGRPLAPGRWLEGHAFSWHGILGYRPWVFPRRHFRLYVPRGWSRAKRTPLVVLIHGCKQSPDEFARGTRIAAAADRAGFLVLMPDQKDSANSYRCWNWFDHRTAGGTGEA